MMKALLISTYELGHQPLGLAQPLAYLRAEGIEARGLDLAIDPLDERLVREANFIGISTPMHTAMRLGIQAAARVRELNPKAHICFYGLYASLNSDFLLRTCADSIIGGEVEEPLARLVLDLALGQAFRRMQTNLGRQQLLVPDRSNLPPLSRYARLICDGEERLAAAVEASRGCAHHCLHCPIPPVYAGRLRIVAAETVLADARQVVAMGAEHITFADPDFFNGVRHSMTVARIIHAEFPRLTFDATIKIEHLIEHRSLLTPLRELGCLFITSAVESLSDTVLANLDKGHSASDVSQALDLTRSAGLGLRPTFVPFTPWTSIEDCLALFDFVEANDLIDAIDPVQYAIRLLVPPGSSLLHSAAMQPYLGNLDERDLAYAWRHPDARMNDLAKRIAAIAGDCDRRGLDPAETFALMRNAARAAAGLAPAAPWCPLASPRRRSPRLSESWFCCAEPTFEQLSAVTAIPVEV
jgi:radical SAM superfamily enzyme YgiQ (UPF0313 family)